MTPQQMASKGRYGDSMLVHMSPQEVGGLQALALAQGGSLTINPDTGLPEAFKLKQLLPTLIGAGLMMIPGVNAVAAPWMIGAGVGGVEALRTGDLGRGLMAGLGAFGGAGMASALGAGAAGAAAGGGGAAAANPYALSAPTVGAGAPSVMGGMGSGITTAGGGITGATGALSQGASAMAPGASGAFTGTSSTGLAAAGGPSTLASAQPSLLSRYTSAMANPLMSANKAAIAGGVGMAAPFLEPKPVTFPEPEDPYAKYTGPYTPTKRNVRYPGLDDIRGGREFSYFDPSNPVPFRSGGSVPMLEDGGFVLTKKAVDGLGKGDNKRGQRAAAMGLGALPIKGKGTGTSDSIKTSIDGKVPALVSNGEAYVPRRNVKKAGGAKKLYALMRKAERRA